MMLNPAVAAVGAAVAAISHSEATEANSATAVYCSSVQIFFWFHRKKKTDALIGIHESVFH